MKIYLMSNLPSLYTKTTPIQPKNRNKTTNSDNHTINSQHQLRLRHSNISFASKYNDDSEVLCLLTAKNTTEQDVMEKLNDPDFVEKIKRFIQTEAPKRIKELQGKKLSQGEKVEFEGIRLLQSVINSSSTTKNIVKTKNISFTGANLLTDNQYCHAVIHGSAATCATISALHADASAWGADAWAQRGTQSLMFTLLGKRLNAPANAAMIYDVKEFYSGASMGVGISKMAVGLTGIVTHAASGATGASVASGGSSHAAISGSVGAINGGLSLVITEKMGGDLLKEFTVIK